MKKILIFTSDLYEGGVAESTRKIAKMLSAKNEVTVCSYDSLPIKKELPANVRLRNLNIPLSAGFRKEGFRKKIVRVVRFPLLLAAALKFIFVVKVVKPDVVYSMTYVPNLINIFTAYLTGHRTIVSERQDPNEDMEDGSLFSKLLKAAYPNANKIHVNSLEMIDAVSTFYKVPDEKIFHFDNFFFRDELYLMAQEDVTDYSFSQGPVIVCSGRLSKQKGQWHLIEIFAELRKIRPDVNLLFLGTGELKEELALRCKQLGIEEGVTFKGDVKNPHKYVARSKLLVFPSIWESFGNSLVEAMCLGVPVATTSCKSGPAQIIEHGIYGTDLGLLPRYGKPLSNESIKEIVNMLVKLLDVKNWEKNSSKSLKGYERFEASHIEHQVLRLFEEN